MSLTVTDHFMACSTCALNYVSSQSPEQCLLDYIKALGIQHYDNGRYTNRVNYGKNVHVFFVGPDMSTLTKGLGHFSEKGSCNQLADYIQEYKLGPVVQAEGRENPLHNERKGIGKLIAYIWSPDPTALEVWHKSRLTGVSL